MELGNLDFSKQMDLEMSKTSFPYFFTEVLGFQFTKFHQEFVVVTTENLYLCIHGWFGSCASSQHLIKCYTFLLTINRLWFI